MDIGKLRSLEEKISREYGNTAGIAVRKDGVMVYEKYFSECTADSHIHVFSVTKSIVSLLIGIAADQGHIKSLDQKVLDFFPGYQIKRGEKTIQQITLRHMLTMTAPYKYKFNPYTKFFTSSDWVKFSLDLLGGRKAPGEFRYAPLIGPDIISGILAAATGQSVLAFAQENLFDPIGISVGKSITFRDKEEQMEFYKATDINGWVADPTGINTAGWGLTLATVDLAKIGQLCLNGGIWNGERLVSQQWIEASTSKHSRWEKQNLNYGYLWWVIDGKSRSFAALGDGGNAIYVNPAKNMVVAISGLFVPKVKDPVDLIIGDIEPIFS